MSEKYKVRDQDKLHFITFAVSYWIDLFTRNTYRNILVESLRHCQQNKGLELYAWVIMSNHIHLIGRGTQDNKLQYTIRDFKKYTSVMVCRAIETNKQESRREWILWMLARAAKKSKKHVKYMLWQNQYHPIELSTNLMMDQRLNYLHNNPVKAGWVDKPEDFLYSSARDYAGRKGLIDIMHIE